MAEKFELLTQLLLTRERHRSVNDWFYEVAHMHEAAGKALTLSRRRRVVLCQKRGHGIIRSEREKYEPITHYCTYCKTFL
jgi:hypothetical protein